MAAIDLVNQRRPDAASGHGRPDTHGGCDVNGKQLDDVLALRRSLELITSAVNKLTGKVVSNYTPEMQSLVETAIAAIADARLEIESGKVREECQ